MNNGPITPGEIVIGDFITITRYLHHPTERIQHKKGWFEERINRLVTPPLLIGVPLEVMAQTHDLLVVAPPNAGTVLVRPSEVVLATVDDAWIEAWAALDKNYFEYVKNDFYREA